MNHYPPRLPKLCILLASAALLCALGLHATDWPQYRGASHDGVSPDRILHNWTATPPVEAWRVRCTNGLASLAVRGGKVFTQIRRYQGGGDKEVCVALDANTGQEAWAAVLGNAQYDGSVGNDDGPRSTPSVEAGRVFVLSSFLVLHCLNATNGTPIWTKDLRALYGGSIIGWQNAASPLVDGDLVFVNCNSPSASLTAFRTSDGSVAWRAHSAPTTHSTPVTATIGGIDQVVFATQNGLWSLNRTNGAQLWRAPYPFSYETCLGGSPVIYSNLVFISANYSMGSYAARVTLSNASFVVTPAWTNTTLKAHWMTPVCHEGYLYGTFGSSVTSPLKCVDIRTGVQHWSVNGFGRGGTVLVDNRLLVLSERGDLVLAEPSPNAYTETARLKLFSDYDAWTNKCWNVPAVCDGRIYARSTAEAVCLDVSAPALKMVLQPGAPGESLVLWIGTDTGAPIDPTRASRIRVLTTKDPAAGPWAPTPGTPVLTDGLLRTEIEPDPDGGFFIATETP